MFEQIKKELDEIDQQLLLLNQKKDTLINLIKLYGQQPSSTVAPTIQPSFQQEKVMDSVPRFQEPIREGTVKGNTGGEIETKFITLSRQNLG